MVTIMGTIIGRAVTMAIVSIGEPVVETMVVDERMSVISVRIPVIGVPVTQVTVPVIWLPVTVEVVTIV